jgi:hypothetical protein
MLTAAAILAAAIATRASLLTSSAGSDWNRGVRNEVKAGAAMLEDVRFVYNVEAGQAFRVAAAQARSFEYRQRAEQAGPGVRAALLVESAAQQMVADVLVESAEIAQDPKYQRDDGSFDLGLRLADVRARNADLVAVDPEADQARGDDRADAGVRTMAATIPVGVAFLLGAMAQAHPRRRRGLLIAGWVSLGLAAAAAIALEVVG